MSTSSLTATDRDFEALKEFGEILYRQFGVRFVYLDLQTQSLLFDEDASERRVFEQSWLTGIIRADQRHLETFVCAVSEELQILGIPFGPKSGCECLAIGVFERSENSRAQRERFDVGGFCSQDLLIRMGDAARESFRFQSQLETREEAINQIASQLSQTYEEITLLYQLTREAQVSRGPAEVQELALTLLDDVLPISQVIFLSEHDDATQSHGIDVLNYRECRKLVDNLKPEYCGRPLVENHFKDVEWASEFTGVDRFILVAVSQAGEQLGWLLALNTESGGELGSVEASLLNAVAEILATHQTNVMLFQDFEKMFFGIVQALSSAIDAKDPYTCGHSQRVGLAAMRLGQELGLSEDDIHLLYLSGLLHDVGKIGIRDAVLLKQDKLTDEEFDHIKEHPTIGYEILSGVRQLGPILAGVRNHHEAMNGRGYPDGLTGYKIPLIARILAVADSYDAMSSDRPYRAGMPPEKVRKIFEECSGTQWDPRVVDAFLKTQSELQELLFGQEQQHEQITANLAGTSEFLRLSQLFGGNGKLQSDLNNTDDEDESA